MRTSEPIWIGESAAGRGVRVTREMNEYPGAQPFYTVTYAQPHTKTKRARYTPDVPRRPRWTSA